jgi:hypothetical protein
MSHQNLHATDAWVITDAQGRIQSISAAAHDVLGSPHLGKGDDLPGRFPSLKKALRFDMEVALTGWPTERTIVLVELSQRPVALRYRVSRKWSADEVGLFWRLGPAEREERLSCA